MFLILNNNDDRILAISEEVVYQSNGYPVINGVAFYNAKVEEVDTMPEGVSCYFWTYADGEFVQLVTPEPVDDPEEIIDILTGEVE